MPQTQLIADGGHIIGTYSWVNGVEQLLNRSVRAGIKHILAGMECEPTRAGIREAINKGFFEEALIAAEFFDQEISYSKDKLSSRLRWATELMVQTETGDPVLKYKLCIYFNQPECADFMANIIYNSKDNNSIKKMINFDLNVKNLKEGQHIADLL